jgi:hypothetical protein
MKSFTVVKMMPAREFNSTRALEGSILKNWSEGKSLNLLFSFLKEENFRIVRIKGQSYILIWYCMIPYAGDTLLKQNISGKAPLGIVFWRFIEKHFRYMKSTQFYVQKVKYRISGVLFTTLCFIQNSQFMNGCNCIQLCLHCGCLPLKHLLLYNVIMNSSSCLGHLRRCDTYKNSYLSRAAQGAQCKGFAREY